MVITAEQAIVMAGIYGDPISEMGFIVCLLIVIHIIHYLPNTNVFLEFKSLLSSESIYFFRRAPKHTETLLFRASVQFIRVGTVYYMRDEIVWKTFSNTGFGTGVRVGRHLLYCWPQVRTRCAFLCETPYIYSQNLLTLLNLLATVLVFTVFIYIKDVTSDRYHATSTAATRPIQATLPITAV